MILDTYLPAFFVFLYGLAIGSFLNVVIYRVPRGKSIVKGGSGCPGCGAPINWYDNIPLVSYLILRGKCRSCGEPISLRYPAVELLTAVVFTCMFFQLALGKVPYGSEAAIWTFPWILRLIAYLWFGAILIASAFIDAEHMIIPNRITLPSLAVGIVLLLSADYTQWANMLLGLVIGGGILLVVALIKHAGMGGGDVKLGAVMGVFLGPQVAIALFVGFLAGSIAGVTLIALKKKTRKDPLPFGPYLVLGAFYGFFFGAPTLAWYIGLLRG
jgi:leader peptidase (prepilin peptidase)/N-methyltransferase